ncbi:MAG: idi [Candidatus Levybacteria bacterium]|nr:idi [Candidatus Levybacteria bacterium]
MEEVVLVDNNNNVLGSAPKLETHSGNTPLHRGFSVFLLNSRGELLLQQRSHTKKTFPLIWSNSLCGHLMLNESSVQAAKRRMPYEIGIDDVEIFEIIPDYRYRVEMNGVWENEICPILVCFTDKKPAINKDEVENIRWIKWQDFLKEIDDKNNTYSMWSKEEAKLLSANKKFQNLFSHHISH